MLFRRRCPVCHESYSSIVSRHERDHFAQEMEELRQAKEAAQALVEELRGTVGAIKEQAARRLEEVIRVGNLD